MHVCVRTVYESSVCNLCVLSEEQWLTLISTSCWITLRASCVLSRQRQEDVTRYGDSVPPLVLCLPVSAWTETWKLVFLWFVFACWSWTAWSVKLTFHGCKIPVKIINCLVGKTWDLTGDKWNLKWTLNRIDHCILHVSVTTMAYTNWSVSRGVGSSA